MIQHARALKIVWSFVAVCSLVASSGWIAMLRADSPRPPNVVLIVIDDFGWADLGCYGSRYYRTPNVDRLAAEGMRFTQAYVACPVCSPTRAALLTGKYPARLHLTDYIPGRPRGNAFRLLRPDFRQQLPLEETTLAEILRAAGYATAAIGKWHLGGEGFEPTRQGFDVAKGGIAAGSVRSHFAPYLRDGQTLPGLDSAPEGEYLADRLTAEAEKFIEEHRAGPFFLYLPHYSVHTPLNGKSDLVTKYEAAVPSGLQKNPIYAAMIESVGRIMRKLEALDLAANTLVVFTSDNGGLATAEAPNTPATNNAPLREGKGYLYEGGIRVPLVVRWPARVKAASTCAAPVSSYDLLPTIAEVCSARVEHAIDGVTLLPLLQGAPALQREALYWHYPHYSPQGGKPGGAIRQGDFKLIEFYEHGRRELFNVAKDVSESTNLIDTEPERAARMAAQLAAWLKAVDAHMPVANPGFAPDTQAADGAITLPAKTAEIHGVMVRYEPLPHKDTIGFWVRADDWVSWDFRVTTPGEFQIEILQGCADGSGGSQVDVTVAGQTVAATVEETGGFQKFVARVIGRFKIAKAGDYTLLVKPRTKPGAAVMDLKQVRLVPIP
jgi:arylsulfatase A-like enzyme